ncbi:type IV toxin-antitoxin system AbiEi family antitoxin [Kineococcus sp. LSe6-4]|uniref:Type IV toxin-antitoxin system AbiEi family antitoxin n=1 Tax=Kineococcus halophytocola TaxID=3234027 RepID=A0ABV4H2F1_9ACTN
MQGLNDVSSVNPSRALMRLHDVGVSLEGLSSAGLAGGGPVVATLSGASRQHRVAVVSSPTMTLTEVLPLTERTQGLPLIVLGPAVSERAADAFRRKRINYVDEQGNAHVQLEGILIDIRGRKGFGGEIRSKSVASANGPLTRSNLFSAKRAQIIFTLLAWPELHEAPMRTVARVAGVSLGKASETYSLLEELGYRDKRASPGFLRREELLEGWLLAYPTGLGRSTRLRDLEGDPAVPLHLDAGCVVSGEYAVPELIKGRSVIIYVEELRPRMVASHRWRPGPRPNIHIRHKFWSEEVPRSEAPHPRTAPPLLIYADLLMASEGRQAEAAHQYRQIHAF